MSFFVEAGFIYFSSDRPGSHATLFGPDGKVPFRDDRSRFSDPERSYTWAFEYGESPRDGQRFVFATADRTVVGEAESARILVVDKVVEVLRSPVDGKPIGVGAQSAVHVASAAVSRPYRIAARSPKVSVATCTYDRPDLLRGAVESMRRQTDPDFEHLIYDNGSTKAEVAEVLGWAARDPRVRIFRGGVNRDQPAAIWNHLFDRARGRYFTVLDDDNEKLPDFVEVMSGELDRNPGLDLVTCGWVVIRPDGDKETDYHLNLSTCVSELDRISTCDGGAMLYRRELFDRAGYFSEAIRTNEDWDWLRRVVRGAAFKNLPTCHATYRSHAENRMLRSAALGSDRDVGIVRAREWSETLGVRAIYPDPGRLTRSQRDVCASVDRALRAIPWVRQGDDVALVVSPFQMDPREAVLKVAGVRRVVTLHMEDPYALSANLDRVRALARVCREVWVATNDRGTVSHYRDVVGDRVVSWVTLGPDDQMEAAEGGKRDIDVLLCGYAYPSRRAFVGELLPLLRGLRVVLVGDGWEDYQAETLPTQDLPETYALHLRSRAVVCLHRTAGDCSDGPVQPETANRGAMEGYSGARVFLDARRGHHGYDEGDVSFFYEPGDLAGALHVYLSGPPAREAEAFREKCRMLYSYRTRIARVINCVRSPRYLAEIP